MTVGELIKELRKHEDGAQVFVQSHDERFVCQLLNVGEDEYGRVYIVAGAVESEWLAGPAQDEEPEAKR